MPAMLADHACGVESLNLTAAFDGDVAHALIDADEQDMVVVIIDIVGLNLAALYIGLPVQDFLRSIFLGDHAQPLQPVRYGMLIMIMGAMVDFQQHRPIRKSGNRVRSAQRVVRCRS